MYLYPEILDYVQPGVNLTVEQILDMLAVSEASFNEREETIWADSDHGNGGRIATVELEEESEPGEYFLELKTLDQGGEDDEEGDYLDL